MLFRANFQNSILRGIAPKIIAWWPLLLTLSAYGGDTFQSADTQTHLVELFSSEGCSSCPPADRWLSHLRQDPGLWKNFVPLEFHVDYWNHLGWVDQQAKSSFTQRQRDYARVWQRDAVYTPAFILDAKEWRSRSIAELAINPGVSVGSLEAERIAGSRYRVRFNPTQPRKQIWLSGAALGNGLVSKVGAGENRGVVLTHDFVVLALRKTSLKKSGNEFTGEIDLELDTVPATASRSVAFWVTEDANGPPIQAVGGDVK